jgi:hypothetical protein
VAVAVSAGGAALLFARRETLRGSDPLRVG